MEVFSMKKTTLYLEEGVLAEIKLISRSEGRSEAEILREAINDYLERRRSALPSIFGKGAGTKFTAADSEDWLLENWKPS
jgi:hypothetical protein